MSTNTSESNHCHICKQKCELTLCKNCYVPLFTPIENHISFAFLKNGPKEIDSSTLYNSVILDYFGSCLTLAEITGFSQLRQLRVSHCQNLTKINLNNLPNLISVDAFFCEKLSDVSITNTPNLIAIDLSFCKELTEVKGEFPKVEYFSIASTKITALPPLPSVKFLDITSSKISDPQQLYNHPNLQRLVFFNNSAVKTIEISQLARHHSFASLICSGNLLDFEGFPSNNNIKNIYFYGNAQNFEKIDFSKINLLAFGNIQQPHFEFDHPICSGDWYESYRYIYGPYPTPPNDSKPKLTKEQLASIENLYPLPQNIDPKIAAYHIMGALFGTAIGDCLGIFCEGHDSADINMYIDQPPEITWTHPVTTIRGSYFHRGSFTDDTALMLMFIQSVVSTAVKNKSKLTDGNDVSTIFDPTDSGRRIHHWICYGIDEHLDGSGIGRGRYTEKVVKTKHFDQDSIKISKKVWEDTGMIKAGNGGVMRTGGCGCFLFWDEAKVIEIAKQFCQCTHYDPRCVFSAVLVSLIISRLLQWRCGIRETFELDDTIDEVKEMFQRKEGDDLNNLDLIDDFDFIDKFLYARTVDDLELINQKIPPTLSTMGCAIWALRENLSYEEGIEAIIRGGGDADTNAACVGAVLGAKWGFGGIPLHLLDYMWYGGILYRDAIPFLKLMGLKFDPPSYEEIRQFNYQK
ncbi:hypothetical protein M9Y10_028633 [Tritrichomonas musculus]|uniref:ADP-ribosylhydrolase ARH3 n=1 Tax=Tritrichomonas musculus TaxID=1915356 RepID=A0ABR2KK23_9EUKA